MWIRLLPLRQVMAMFVGAEIHQDEGKEEKEEEEDNLRPPLAAVLLMEHSTLLTPIPAAMTPELVFRSPDLATLPYHASRSTHCAGSSASSRWMCLVCMLRVCVLHLTAACLGRRACMMQN